MDLINKSDTVHAIDYSCNKQFHGDYYADISHKRKPKSYPFNAYVKRRAIEMEEHNYVSKLYGQPFSS
jgi:hypothetical protein